MKTFRKAIATIYNIYGYVVGCDFTYANTDDLNPGQSSSFKITAIERDNSDVATYRLQPDGDPQ